MNSITIKPSKLKGEIKAPPSKSLSHRAIICASLCSSGESLIDNVVLSEDIKATIEGMRSLGAKINLFENSNGTYSLRIKRETDKIQTTHIDCRESGSTLRFMIPLGSILSEECTFTGSGKLVERPLDVYYKIFDEQKIKYKTTGGLLPLSVHGSLISGSYKVSGNISSQFISGLLLALPLLSGDSTVKIKGPLESKGYVDLTLDILSNFKINIVNNGYKEFKIHGNSVYEPANYTVEGDLSQAAFFLVAHEIGNDLICNGFDSSTKQGDKEILNIIEKYKHIEISSNEEIIIDASQIPDLVPILAVLASLKNGITTKIINAERLRIKESDRLRAISTEMNKLGASIRELPDGLLIKGLNSLAGGAAVNSWNDHRIAMSLAIAATKCEKEIILENHTAVNKSYPSFWDDYKALGGMSDEFDVRQ
ncbi:MULTISPECIES: 3-phosphoshikimate 1-carboxyvinyltransferase [unclassified Sedimentibacter]|uniref:3-phosphoshikimate 1-carboxyvinyltransferase n=1 Tax=unclassified Sedimentibacter TaxID=2649220 RepID=UPI0027E1D029|nr:3-phosphoshikimate 1-carboxyvinyltransferase [Sedimentibacter sp. MB35-C1]WMJ77448.1 3-phosphoshikimate 1-carboxyvinyltransferase [Sedimentibacter sp. MB35-C1]